MQKMVKRGFRGERKRILTPSLSQGEGECSDGKGEFGTKIYSFKGECGDGKGGEMTNDE